MQTTLLGLAIAFIIALVAALVGPHFIDWTRFRPQFEVEASRILGAPVRVSGSLDARLLPTPSLRLQSVVVGGPNDPGRIRADTLAVEFSLGSLMRGEWRATELTVNGVALDLGLDQKGRIDWPVSSDNSNLAALAIDRVNLTGRVALHDAASRSTLELNDIAFSGDVRGLAGSVRGNGNFTVSGTRYPFRVSSSQDAGGARIRLTLDPGLHGWMVDLDGALAFEARVPHFDGTMAVARSAPDGTAPDSVTPWRLTTKLKADPVKASLAQLEVNYGRDDAAMKLTGLADFRFGAKPLLQALLSAKQLDADKLLAKQSGSTEPVQMMPGLRTLLAALPHAPLPTRIDINAERIMLGGRPVQDLDLTLRAAGGSWSVDRLEARAPGATDISIQGALASAGAGDDASADADDSFKGALKIDSSDPGTFTAWLLGRSDVTAQKQKALHVAGNVHLASDRIAIDDLKADADGGAITGRIAWAARKDGNASAFDADLAADRLDLDAAMALVRGIGIPQQDWPDRGQLAVNIARAVSSGQELRPFVAKLRYDDKTIALDALRVGQARGLTMDGSGVFHRDAATGQVALQAAAPSVSDLADLIAPLAPSFAERLKAQAGQTPGAARLKLALDLDKDAQAADRASARASLELTAPQFSGNVTLRASPLRDAVHAMKIDALAKIPFDLTVDASAENGATLLRWFGLDHALAAGEGVAYVTGSARGMWDAAWQVKAALSAGALTADVHGSVSPTAQRSADLVVKLQGANITPLLGLDGSSTFGRDASLSSHVTRDGDKMQFGDVDATVAGTRLRGRVSVMLGDNGGFDGELGMDKLDLPQALALLIGASSHDNGAPLGRNLLQGRRGKIDFQALRGELPAGLELQPVSGVLKSDGQSLAISAMKGKIGGGEARADLDARQLADGLALSGNVQLDGVDGAALRYRGLAMPSGKTSVRMTLASQGRSIAALTGAMTGSGTLTIDAARIAGLNPDVFEIAIKASDAGKVANEDQLRQIVAPELQRGDLSIKQAQIPFLLRDGRFSVGATTLETDTARAVVSGGYDIVADQVDIRASLTSRATEKTNGPPQLDIFAVGTPDTLVRTVDVSGLSSWLALRAIDRETRRLDAISRGEGASPSPAAPQPPVAPAPAVPKPEASKPEAPKPETSKPADTPQPPTAAAPVPDSDPRRAPPKPKEATPKKPATSSQSVDSPTGHAVTPLPPPIEVRPAPGAKTAPKPRAPLVLTPQIAH
ncbi:MAG: AsmA family protein [Rhizobiales bacterium]|nr:AsmA family protein [Hyphomicrobiales bacterium]